MKSVVKHNGFSLTEVLMAVAILSVGMMLIATMFPVGIYLTGVAFERTIAAVVIDEAFAKIKLYGIGNANGTGDYNDIPGLTIDPCEFSYPPLDPSLDPSLDPCSTTRQYYWSALYRKLSENEYLITVFVTRKTNAGLMYPYPPNSSVDRPRLIKISVTIGTANNELIIQNAGEEKYINPQTTIIDNATGQRYRVIDRKDIGVNPVVVLDRNWEGTAASPQDIWLIPPPETGGKNADIEVIQRIMRF